MSERMYHPDTEALPREELVQLQIERLQSTINRACRNVAFYRELFERHRIDPEAIRSIGDMASLPFTTVDDLCRRYPYGMFAVPLRDIVRIHATAGNCSHPLVSGYTRNDLSHWSHLVARGLHCVGVSEHDVLQIAFGYSLSTAGLGFHYGAEHLGASVIPASCEVPVQDQSVIMKDYKATVLACMPGFALTMAASLAAQGIEPQQLALRKVLLDGGIWGQKTRLRLEQALHVDVYATYGAAGLAGAGCAGECTSRNGLHISEDHFIAEVIDPRTLEVLGKGEEGELVLTTITREAFPLIRFRTGDRTTLLEGACPCGRTFVRMEPVRGRTDDLFDTQGKKLSPAVLAEVIDAAEGGKTAFRVVLGWNDSRETLTLQLGITPTDSFMDELSKLEARRKRVARAVAQRFGVDAEVTFVEALTLQEGEQGLVQDTRGM